MSWWKIWKSPPPDPGIADRPRESSDGLAPIRQAAAGLMFPSESDAPFEPFLWDAAAPGRAARDAVAAHVPRGSPIEVVPFDQFFADLESTEDGQRFRALRAAMTAQLRELTVVRAGEVQVEIYVIGRTPAGRWAGLRTTSVET